jgi:hypothetical protein
MVYRIRYVDPGVCHQAEETVEANSPAEAMVKFRATHRPFDGRRSEGIVTSVSAEESFACSQW